MPEYYGPSNFISLTLDSGTHPSGLDASETSITVNEAISSLEDVGYLTLERADANQREIVKWTSKDDGTKTFTVTRGQDGTSGQTHVVGATIAITGNAAYFNDLETYVDDTFASPPAIGNTAANTVAATTLTTTGAATFGGAIGTSLTSGNFALFSGTLTGNTAGYSMSPTVSGSTISSLDNFTSAITLASSGVVTNLKHFEVVGVVPTGTTVSNWYGSHHSFTTIDGTVTNRYLIYDEDAGGTNQFVFGTGYGSGGVLSGVTTHDTESDELIVNINGTTKYIKLYVT